MTETPTPPRLDLTAQCACGAIEMSLRGRVLSMFFCACEDCQKATGTGHSTVALVRGRDLTIIGQPRSYARPAASGATFTRHFCGDCGTPLYGATSRAAELAMVPVGFFGRESTWFAPNQVIFARSQRSWDTIADHLPRHETYRDGGGI